MKIFFIGCQYGIYVHTQATMPDETGLAMLETWDGGGVSVKEYEVSSVLHYYRLLHPCIYALSTNDRELGRIALLILDEELAIS